MCVCVGGGGVVHSMCVNTHVPLHDVPLHVCVCVCWGGGG